MVLESELRSSSKFILPWEMWSLEKCGGGFCLFVCLVGFFSYVCLFLTHKWKKDESMYWPTVFFLSVSLFVYLTADSPVIGHTSPAVTQSMTRKPNIHQVLHHNKMAVECGAVLVICGGVLVHLTLGTLYTFGKSPLFQKHIRNFQYT